MAETFTIRKADKKDIDQIWMIELQQAKHAWKKEYFLSELSNNIAEFYVILGENNNQVLGFANIWIIETEMEIHNIAVREEFTRRHLATRMMEFLLKTAEEKGVDKIFLEVRQSNYPAIALYENFGFKRTGQRKNYYHNPVEDAEIYSLICR